MSIFVIIGEIRILVDYPVQQPIFYTGVPG